MLAVDHDEFGLLIIPRELAELESVRGLALGIPKARGFKSGPVPSNLEGGAIRAIDNRRGIGLREALGNPVSLKGEKDSNDGGEEGGASVLGSEDVRDELGGHPVVIEVALEELVEVERARLEDLANRP
jgi:hypothetical protein